MEIILGSQSPRRRELMAGLNLPFTAITIDADESYPASLQAGDIPYYISRAKARAYEDKLLPDQLLITADTIVWLDGRMLGKPHDEAEAITMLKQLSGKTHQVYTAVTFAQKGKDLDTIVDKTDVTFAELSDDEIHFYIDHYRPFDKAGAYGVQEWIGYIACTAMNGSYFNVMGLPVHKVYEYIKNHTNLFAL